MTNVKREADHIWESFRRYHRDTGEVVVWYEFIPLGASTTTDSLYDDVYDEGVGSTGGLRYKDGVVLPAVQIHVTEDTKRATTDGRHPVQTTFGVISVKDMRDAGVSDVSEYRHHLNDMYYYDGRYYSVTAYRVRGRAQDDIIVAFEGIERYIDEEFPRDPGPTTLTTNDYSWPAAFPA